MIPAHDLRFVLGLVLTREVLVHRYADRRDRRDRWYGFQISRTDAGEEQRRIRKEDGVEQRVQPQAADRA